MRQLLEDWNRFLNEISFEDAKKVLDGKRVKKLVRRQNRDMLEKYKDVDSTVDEDALFNSIFSNFKLNIAGHVPTDISDKDQGQALLWLIRAVHLNDSFAKALAIGRQDFSGTAKDLELFFQYKQEYKNALSESDINKIKSIEELKSVVDEARPKIEEYRDKKASKDAEAGQEILRDDEEWKIAVIHNKGAACELGKQTDWCTAAPGLDYFEQYYKPNDPLFFFLNKQTGEKYQFHYGTSQFMDKNDVPLKTYDKGTDLEKKLHNMLFELGADKKYKILTAHKLKAVAANENTDKKTLSKLARNEFVNVRKAVAENPSTNPEDLRWIIDNADVEGENFSDRLSALSNKNLPADILIRFAKTGHPGDLLRVSKNSSSPEEALLYLLKKNTLMLTFNVAQHQSITDRVVLEILKSEKYGDNTGIIKQLALNESLSSKMLNEILKSTSKLPDNSRSMIKSYIMSNPNITDEILLKLANDPVRSVRFSLARHKNTPINILKILANDSVENISYTAKNAIEKLEKDQQLDESLFNLWQRIIN